MSQAGPAESVGQEGIDNLTGPTQYLPTHHKNSPHSPNKRQERESQVQLVSRSFHFSDNTSPQLSPPDENLEIRRKPNICLGRPRTGTRGYIQYQTDSQ